MNRFALKPVLAALVLAGSCAAANAARLEIVSYDPVIGSYSSLINGLNQDDFASDLSDPTQVSVFAANAFDSRGYDLLGSFDATKQKFFLSNNQYLEATATSGTADALLSLPGIRLRVAAEAGDVAGSAVQVSFMGVASALNSFSAGSLFMDMAVTTTGGATLGAYLWDASLISNDSQNIDFSFTANIGDEVVLSGNMLSSLTADGSAVAATGQIDGAFSVTAVPEPESYAMLLAGLGLIGYAARRRARA